MKNLILDNKLHERLLNLKYYFITDIDGTLIYQKDNEGLEELNTWIEKNRHRLIFGVATGRDKSWTKRVFEKYDLATPDIIICSAGSELYYTKDFIPDTEWTDHIAYQWDAEKLKEILSGFQKISLQDEEIKSPFKVSFQVKEGFEAADLSVIHDNLEKNEIQVNIHFSYNTYLDFFPIRASKGKVLKYLSQKWNSPLSYFVTAGNGANDLDMLKGEMKGIVVGNYKPPLEVLRGEKDIYFASHPSSKGIMEGIHYFDFRHD
ncbi:MAG: HAD-IIB family hydrolase [Bacteroidetes bacterium]|nr:HAD-IIB family hydrolase [Bacteroidota bacterium]